MCSLVFFAVFVGECHISLEFQFYLWIAIDEVASSELQIFSPQTGGKKMHHFIIIIKSPYIKSVLAT